MKLCIRTCHVAETDLFLVDTEDGPQETYKMFIAARDHAGNMFAHFKLFELRADAEAFRARVEKHGIIDTQYWRVVETLDLEKEFAPFGPAWQFEEERRRWYRD